MLPLLLALAAPPPTHAVELDGHRFTVPAGFAVERLATPPDLRFPVAAAFDDAGNLYVTEASGTNDNVQKQAKDRPHRVWRLPAGRPDRGEVFADRLMLPQGVMWHDGAVFVGAPPTITRIEVRPDGTAGERTVWHDGQVLTGCANDVHGPYPGPDGWVYWTKGAFAKQSFTLPTGKPFTTRAAHIYRARPGGSGVEPVFAAGMDNPVDVVFTPGGERIVAGTFLQHPAGGKRDGLIHAVYGGVWGKDHAPIREHPWTGPTLMPAMTHLGPAAPSGLHRYASTAFGRPFEGNLFSTGFNLRTVWRHVLVPDGATFRTEDSPFLQSDNLDFHPTDVTEDPDGNLLVVDTGGWYKLCCPTSQLVKPDVPGAVYRVRLVNGRPGTAAEEYPVRYVWEASRREARALGGAGEARHYLAGTDETTRQAAAHVVGLYRVKEAVPDLLKLLATGTPHNKRAAAEALGRIGDRSTVPALLAAHRGVTDRFLQHSLTYALIEIGDRERTAAGLADPHPDVQRAAMVALDGMGGDRLPPDAVVARLAAADAPLREAAWWVAGRHPAWGDRLAPAFRTALAAADGPDEELTARLAKFAGVPAVQAVLAEAATASHQPGRRTALRVMARSGLKTLPAGWREPLLAAAADPDLLLLAVAVLKAVPATAADFATLVGKVADADRLAVLVARPKAARLADADFARLLTALPRDHADRAAAVEAVCRGGLTADQLAAVADALSRAAVTDLPRLLDQFAAAPEPAVLKLLAAIASDPGLQSAVRPEAVRPVVAKASPAVQDAAKPVLARLEAGLADQRGKLEALLADLPMGDVRRGQQVFNGAKANCIGCHQMGYVGGSVGPDLTRIGGIRAERDLLEAIVYPSASFVRSYEPVTAATADGRSVNGVLRRDEPEAVVIAVSATEEVRIPRSDLDALKPGTVSVMPGGFDQQLTKQELADLVAFLKASR